VVCLGQNPLLKPTGSSASGWRLLLPGRAFASSWSLSSLRLATTPLIDSPFSISDPGLQTILESGPWTKLHTNTSSRAPGCLSGVLRSAPQQTGQFGFSGSGKQSTSPCLPFSMNCWTKWCCHSSSRSTNTASLGETMFMRIASTITSSE
jgi:hypothetical protein